ncbi:patatin-like phospholipase family protein [Kitasatospora sp. NPDC004745]|uniref:patatin-like phospholipase family protein n=1 Tax=Kitasatospora sp. NPDC004745 TaxID=3364019 RepID=UPI0036B1BAC6
MDTGDRTPHHAQDHAAERAGDRAQDHAARRTDGQGAPDRALVLGPGGRLGAAWTAGLVHGLHLAGADPAGADLIVGTSAGAVVGALLATGQDPSHLVDPARRTAPRPGARRPDPAAAGAVFAVLGQGLDPAEARRRVGRLALDTADPDAEQALLDNRRALIGTHPWPRHLLITAVDAGTGEPAVWSAHDGLPLLHAVAASSAFPGVEPPVTLPDGRRCMDGSLRAGANADLAAGARAVLVVEPLAHRFPRPPADAELVLAPDPAGQAVLDSDRADWDTWEQAYREGLRQAGGQARAVRAAWGASTT